MQLLSGGGGVWAPSGRAALLRAVVHALLAFDRDLLLINATHGSGCLPHVLSDSRSLLFLNARGGGHCSPLPLKSWRSCQKSPGCLRLGNQMGAVWFQRVGHPLLPAPGGREGVVRKSALQCLHANACTCWRDQPARP